MSEKKSKDAKAVENRLEKFETLLRCQLTNDELISRGNELAEASAEAGTLEDTLASIKKEFAAKIAGKEARINELSGTIRAKSETRIVKCEREFLYGEGLVMEIRADTKETIKSREMRDDERQQELEV